MEIIDGAQARSTHSYLLMLCSGYVALGTEFQHSWLVVPPDVKRADVDADSPANWGTLEELKSSLPPSAQVILSNSASVCPSCFIGITTDARAARQS